MSHSRSRREFVHTLALTAGLAAVLRNGRAFAAPLPHLDPTDAMAKGLGYVEDASKVDPKTPGFGPGKVCENCMQINGGAGEAYRPCKVFPGKAVSAKGWCKAWAKQI